MGQMQIVYSSTDCKAVMPGRCLIHFCITKEDYHSEILFYSIDFLRLPNN